jgi:hypothetical protein
MKDWWEQIWIRVGKTLLNGWTKYSKARAWMSARSTELIPAAAITVGLVLLAFGQATAAATLIGACFLLSHNIAQRRADFRRRITESFGKAVSQLASDKIEERMGGIYSLEKIAQESPDDFAAVMETLAAFILVRAPRMPEQDMPRTMASFYESAKPANWREREADIAAVLAVIWRRDKVYDKRYVRINLSATDLEGAPLFGATLQSAILRGSNLNGAILGPANLSYADLVNADLIAANLNSANLNSTNLTGANLAEASLTNATLSRANLTGTNFTGTNLSNARGLTQAQLDNAYGTNTKLPEGLTIDPRHPNVRSKQPPS